MNADKTEYMCFNQECDISTLNGDSPKSVDKFTYLGSSISSTESEIVMRLAKAWNAIDTLSIISKSLTSSSCVNSTIWMHHMEADKAYGEKARRELHKNAMSYIEQILEGTYHKKQLYGYRPPIS